MFPDCDAVLLPVPGWYLWRTTALTSLITLFKSSDKCPPRLYDCDCVRPGNDTTHHSVWCWGVVKVTECEGQPLLHHQHPPHPQCLTIRHTTSTSGAKWGVRIWICMDPPLIRALRRPADTFRWTEETWSLCVSNPQSLGFCFVLQETDCDESHTSPVWLGTRWRPR